MTIAPAEADVSAAVEIAANNAAFCEAVTRRDAPAIAGCYGADALLLPPGYPAQRGREAVEAFWAAGIAAGLCSLALETLSLEVHGDLAIEVGRSTVVVAPEEGERREEDGKYVVVHRREAGRWLWVLEVFNSDGPWDHGESAASG